MRLKKEKSLIRFLLYDIDFQFMQSDCDKIVTELVRMDGITGIDGIIVMALNA